jgi:hypothetical protein
LSYVHELDKTAGARALGPEQTVSSKVQATLQSAQQQARTLDEQKGISKTFYTVCCISPLPRSPLTQGLCSQYLSQALASPIGQKVRAFYTETSKQVQDIHEEARRIAEERKQHAQGGSPPPATPAAGAEGAKPAVGASV